MGQDNNSWIISVSKERTTHLYTAAAVEIAGDLKRGMANTQILWHGPGHVAWEVDTEEEGDYEIAVCYAAFSEGVRYEVSSASGGIQGMIRRTEGYFNTMGQMLNFERDHVKGNITLRKGINRIVFRVGKAPGDDAFSLSSIEILPVNAKMAVEEEKARAAASLASTDQFAGMGYGIMLHWTSQSQPRHGRQMPYKDAVAVFDVEAFAEMAESTGAGYVMFTANHADPHFPAPVSSWERLFPGWTTGRDLIAELASALKARGIGFMLYMNPFAAYIASSRMRNTDGSTVYTDDTRMDPNCRDEYLETTCEILREIGRRYGDAVEGYWFDSCYQPYMHFGSFPTELLFRAAKEGNPKRICTFNHWILPVNSPFQEYWAGEAGALGNVSQGRYIENGAGKGLQSHALIIMDDPWVHDKPETGIADPHYTAEELTGYIREDMQRGGVLTINLGIYQDGNIGSKTLQVMREVKKAIRNC